MNIDRKLEEYTRKNPREVLLVTVSGEEGEERIMIFRGFSSSLTGSTAYDPDIPVIPAGAKITRIDRLESPYNPENPRYIQKDLSPEEIAALID